MFKKYIFLIPVFLLASVALSMGYNNYKKTSISPSPTPEIKQVKNKITLTIDYGNGESITNELTYYERITVYDALKKTAEDKNIAIETKRYSFGTLIESINALKSNMDKAWIFFVNAKAADKSADSYILSPNDKVEWKYITPSEN